jgi:DNA-binding transcriptional regulator PaaX
MTRISNLEPSIMDLILATLTSGRSVRQFRSILSERKFQRYKKESIKVELARMHRKKYINKFLDGWSITDEGRRYSKQIQPLSYLLSPFTKNSISNTIISFDIPEKNRAVRNWLRNQIKIFGYKMLQQSLWIGPGPLPIIFIKRLEYLDIRKNVKIFKINSKSTS